MDSVERQEKMYEFYEYIVRTPKMKQKSVKTF